MNTLSNILNTRTDCLSLVLGNGINRFGLSGPKNSWEQLLTKTACSYFPGYNHHDSEGVSLIELYDLIELKHKRNKKTTVLAEDICSILRTWKPFDHHFRITNWAKHSNTPILTSNFDTLLSDSCGATLHRMSSTGFTSYYPWSSYYSTQEIQDIQSEFAIWHMHGMLQYRQSIRLGLSHYMGSVHRLRSWLYRGRRDRLFASMYMLDQWKGGNTWLQAFFGNDLLFIGISLDQVEVFLRWCLIERKKLYQKFPKLKRKAWFVYKGTLDENGKAFFLRTIGVEPVRVDSYEEMYESNAWNIL